MGMGELGAEVVDDEDEFSALAEEWAQLYQAAPRATPFQTHSWLDSWWCAYGHAGRLRVVLVRDGSATLVAAAPVHLERRGPVRVLIPLGGAITDYTDVLIGEHLVEPQQVSAVAAALARGLLAVPGWDVLDLPEVRPDGAAELLLAAWPGPRWSLDSSPCVQLGVSTFDELMRQFSPKRAGDLRRQLRRSDKLGLVLTDVPAEDVEQGVRDLIRVHAERWEGRGVNRGHLEPRFTQHLTSALSNMVRDGQAALTRFVLDGEVVAVKLVLLGHDMLGGYLMGTRPSLYQRMNFFSFVLREDLQRMERVGLTTFSMLRGRESYKDHWRPVVVINRRILLGRRGATASFPYALIVLGMRRAVAFARQHTPRLHKLVQRLAVLRRSR